MSDQLAQATGAHGPGLPHPAKLSARITRDVADFTIDVSLELRPGITALLGPSGAGKTTILRCIAGITEPTKGRIAWGDDVWFDATQGKNEPAHLRRAALVFQTLALFPHLTALQNVTYGMPKRLSRTRRDEQALELLSRMHVAHLARRLPSTFSGGEGQRVALARAFAMSPRVLLLDEPFSSLDAALKEPLLDEARAWIERANIPTLLVTHDAREVDRLGARVIRLDRGRELPQ